MSSQLRNAEDLKLEATDGTTSTVGVLLGLEGKDKSLVGNVYCRKHVMSCYIEERNHHRNRNNFKCDLNNLFIETFVDD